MLLASYLATYIYININGRIISNGMASINNYVSIDKHSTMISEYSVAKLQWVKFVLLESAQIDEEMFHSC